MEIQNKRTRQILAISTDDWLKMQNNGLSRNFKIVDATDKEIVKKLNDPPIEVIDFLKAKEVVMADNDTGEAEMLTVKRRKVKGAKTVEGGLNDIVANAESVEATTLPEPTLTATAIELAHEEPEITYTDIEFTVTNNTNDD